MSFKDLSTKEWILKTLESVNIRKMTEIQQAALPLALKGHDILGKLISQRDDWLRKNTGVSSADSPEALQ